MDHRRGSPASHRGNVFEIVLLLIRSGLVATSLFILILIWSEYHSMPKYGSFFVFNTTMAIGGIAHVG